MESAFLPAYKRAPLGVKSPTRTATYSACPGHLNFHYTTDTDLVKSLLTEPRCFRRMNNSPKILAAIQDMTELPSRLLYLVPSVKQDAVFVLGTVAPAVAEVHFCVAPSAWGHAEYIFNEFLRWIWRNTSLVRLIGPVPAHNRLAIRIAKRVGFQHTETLAAAVEKDGTEYDLLVMEISRAA